jgi:hypothetical protein
MESVSFRKLQGETVKRRYGSEAEVELLTGFSKRTLQQDRLLGRMRFPYYKVGGKILYDLTEVEATIRAAAVTGPRL